MYKGRNAAVIIAAGGAGSRFGSEIPKQFLDMDGESMLVRAVRPFSAMGVFDEIVVVVPEDRMDDAKTLLRAQPCRVCAGGADRAASVRAGLAAISARDGLVLIHDAARPCVTQPLIGRVLEAAHLHGAAVPVVPVRDTIYQSGKAIDREALSSAQTPQGFDLGLIREAHRKAAADGLCVTDDGMPVLRYGGRVELTEGDEANRKITLAADMNPPREKAMPPFRVGMGFDVHRFAEGRKLILGGVEIPFPKGLIGHSDADVLTHALMDALLGAMGLGDIGQRFPDTDERYRGVSGMLLLGEVAALLRERGFALANADLTLICEAPRMAPYRSAAERSIAAALGTAPEKISVKATTTERLGFTGREEGIAAEAVVLLYYTK
ncbi:MAG: 2-C-methyl-D-erythritol 4-phosphate cytidylyltransferase [Clostridiales Family XIII bacterium]|jgi:2-C-methyl-D-erythritol 4-phosphate cytidylyltransferase/2-C-methyl-D-erythritol 2,4-cyclodiphosphate synthase|nr:2-C-methyl-D-erythritol 4-phosphate cytidylyltransferase [Clostridiales Family XIII bacterium]